MSPECFDILHDLIASATQGSDTLIRDAIPSRIKLEVALSFLATGNSYRNLQHLFLLVPLRLLIFCSEVLKGHFSDYFLQLARHVSLPRISGK
jgi:hypothetical protein